MNQPALKRLPVGESCFPLIISNGCYYVDKTPFLRKVFFEDDSTVLLFTRPRRFGKSLLMDMFCQFLQCNDRDITDKTSIREYFKDTAIIQDEAFCAEFMGEFPVISISLKDVYGDTLQETLCALADLVADTAFAFSYLSVSSSLSEIEKRDLGYLLDRQFLKANIDVLTEALRTLSKSLSKHYNRQVILLIDEYDVPLAKASAVSSQLHTDIVKVISKFLGLLKDGSPGAHNKTRAWKKVVLTGCLKVAKNSIFTGVNNFTVNTILETGLKFPAMFGFTREDTDQLLTYYGMTEYAPLVREHYDGYRFGGEEIYNPWDVINFVKRNLEYHQAGQKNNVKALNYWSNSSSDCALKSYIGYLTKADNNRMQALMDGETITITVNDQMNYDDLSKHNPDDFWSLLLHTGYLTPVRETGTNTYAVRLPNQEVRVCFKDSIMASFQDYMFVVNDNLPQKIARALLNGQTRVALECLTALLRVYVSVSDNNTKAPHENFYQGLFAGIFSGCADIICDYRSNFAAGDGYADVGFLDTIGTTAVILELKAARDSTDLLSDCEDAIEQIHKKHYAEPYVKSRTVTDVRIYGAAFCGRRCWLTDEKLK